MAQNNSERELKIEQAGKKNLLDSVKNRVQKQMMPNFVKRKNEDKTEYLNFMREYIKGLKGTDPYGLGTIIGYPQIMRDGIMGVVFSFTVQGGKKYIFKTGLFPYAPQGLGPAQTALQERSKQGVKVPTLIHEGNLLFQDEPVLFQISEFIKPEDPAQEKGNEFFEEMGQTMAKMHRVKGEGFDSFTKVGDRIVGDSDVYKPFPRKIEHAKNFVFSRNLINEKTFANLTEWAYQTLLGDFRAGEKPTLIHKDMGIDNIIYSKPITVIDPNPRLGHAYEDIAEYYVKAMTFKRTLPRRKENIINHMFLGYEAETGKKIDRDLLDAAIIVRGMRKMYTRLMRVNESATADVESVAKLLVELAEKHGLRAS